MKAGLIQIDARQTGGAIVPVRLCNFSDSLVCHLDGQQWDPAVIRLPALRYDFFGGRFQNAVSVPQTTFTVAVDALTMVPPALLATLRFGSARVRVWTGEAGAAFGSYQLRFDGEIKAEPTIEEGVATFSAGAADAWMDVPLLRAYAGTGGLEGPDELAGTVKPLVLGNCRFVPGVLIDPVDNVYQVSAYGPVQGISAAFDRLNSLGASSGNYANLAALLGATIGNGSWATCLALGLVRLGAPADGRPSFHVQGDAAGAGGYVTRAGGFIRRALELAGGSGDLANLAQLDTDRPWDQALVLREQVTARSQIQQLADSVAAVSGITWTGTLFVKAYGFATPSITLDTAGISEPIVATIGQQPVDPPFWRLATNAAVTWSVHSLGEIATDLVLRGPWSGERTYRADDLVFAADGRSFIYINETPSAGHAPPALPETVNEWWQIAGGATANVGRGSYSAEATFNPGDIVLWAVADGGDGGGYVRIGEGPTTGTPPSNASFWKPFVERGEAGATGTSGAAAVEASLQPPAMQVKSFANGGITDWGGIITTVRVLQGSTDVASSFNLSIVANPQGLNTTIDNGAKTVAVFNAGTASGEFGVETVDKASLTIRATGSGAYAGITRDLVLSLTKLRGGYEIVEDTDPLPTTNLFEGRMVFKESDGKTYTIRGGVWSSSTDASDIIGQLESDQLGDEILTARMFASRQVLTQHLAVADFENLALNGSLQTGTLDGWTRVVANTGAGSIVSVGTDPVDWPSQHAIFFYRAPGDGSELSIVNGTASWDAAGYNDGIQLDPGEELYVEATLWCSSAGVLFGFDVLGKGVGGSLTAITCEALQNCFVGGGTQVWYNGGPIFTNVSFAARNTTGGRQRVFVRAVGPAAGGAQGYLWNLKIRRRNNAKVIIDGEITAQKVAAGAVTAAKMAVTQLSGITADLGTVTAGVLQNPTGATRFDLTSGRITFNNGVFMKVTGNGFGSANQFIEWFGPSQSNVSLCTEANAITFLKTNGTAYFRGQVLTSSLTYTGGGALTTVGSEVVLGPFPTIGSGIDITATLSCGISGPWYEYSSGSAGGGSAVARLECRTGPTDDWFPLGDISISLSATWSTATPGTGGDPMIPGSYSAGGTGTITASWPPPSMPDAYLRVRLISFSDVVGPGGVAFGCLKTATILTVED